MICEGQREGTVATGYASAVMSALVLATTGILIRYLTEVHGIEPIVLAFWRNIFLVTLLFLALECFFPILVEIEQSDLIPLAGFGLVLAIFNFLWTTSVSVNGAGVATFLVYSSVAFTALLGRIVLGEELGLLKVLSIISAVIGCLLVTGGNVAGGKIPELNGVLLGLGSGFCFALYTLLGKTHRNLGYNSWTIMLYSFGFAALFLLIGKVGLEVVSGTVHTLPTSFFSLSLSGWIVLGILAIGPTLIGFWLYTFSLGSLPASVVNLIATMEPPFTVIMAYLFLNEQLQPVQIGGSFVILGAIVVLNCPFRITLFESRAVNDHA